MEVVTEHLINEEQKQREKDSHEIFTGCKALTVSHSEKGMVKCYNWGKLGRLKKPSFPVQLELWIRYIQHSEGECYILVVEHVSWKMGFWIPTQLVTCATMRCCSPNYNRWRREQTWHFTDTDYFNDQNYFYTTTCLWHSHALQPKKAKITCLYRHLVASLSEVLCLFLFAVFGLHWIQIGYITCESFWIMITTKW